MQIPIAISMGHLQTYKDMANPTTILEQGAELVHQTRIDTTSDSEVGTLVGDGKKTMIGRRQKT